MTDPDYALSPYIYYSGGYHLIAADRIAAAGVTYSRGMTDELDLNKGSLAFRILDDDDTYRPTNPESGLYGILGQYLPVLYKVDGVARFAGEIELLTPGQTDDHQTVAKVTSKGLRWVDFKATGPLGTVGRWRDVTASPMRLQITSLPSLRGYYPGEDGSDSASMSSAYPGVGPAKVTGTMTFAGADGPAGSDKLLKIGSGGKVQGTFHPDISTTSWQLSFSTDVAGADGTERQCFIWRTSNGYWWVWQASSTTYRGIVIDPSGTQILSSGVGNGGIGPGSKIVFRHRCTLAAGNWTWEAGWYEQNDPVLTGTTFTPFAGTAGKPLAWSSAENTVMNGAFLGHVFACTGTSDNLQSYDMLNAINGYPSETTDDRLTRMLKGRGIPLEILGDHDFATPMGVQRPATIKEQAQEIQRTEQGLIFESPDGRGLRFALRNYLYDQANTPALTLTYPDDIGPGLAELATTLDLYNTVIAQDRSGASATAVQPDGRYGTADAPDGSGVLDKAVPVNLFDPDSLLPAGAAVRDDHCRPRRQPGPARRRGGRRHRHVHPSAGAPTRPDLADGDPRRQQRSAQAARGHV
jgi:hypothetical protein